MNLPKATLNRLESGLEIVHGRAKLIESVPYFTRIVQMNEVCSKFCYARKKGIA